jgi:hypothetical protein
VEHSGVRHVLLRPQLLLLLLLLVVGAATWLLYGAPCTTCESSACSPSCQLLQHAGTATAAAHCCMLQQQALQLLHSAVAVDAAAVTQHALVLLQNRAPGWLLGEDMG